MKDLFKDKKQKLERGADRATRWIGSTRSLLVHTALFVVAFVLPFFGIAFERVLLVVTTIVSLEAIYLSIFIQMSVNKNTSDIEEIQENVEDIQEDVEDIQEDIEDIEENVDEIQEDIEEDVVEEEGIEQKEAHALASIQEILNKLQKEIEQLKKK